MFHIKWPVGVLAIDSSSVIASSAIFELTTTSGTKLSFQFKFDIDLLTKSRLVITLIDCSFASEDNNYARILQSYHPRPYFSVRLGLSNAKKDDEDDLRRCVLWPFSSFARSTKDTSLGWQYVRANDNLASPSPMLETLEQGGKDGFVVHCWLDVWERGASSNPGDTTRDPHRLVGYRRNGLALFASSMGQSFDEVQSGDRSEFSDVTLITKDHEGIEHRTYCHRIVLCARSAVFKSMLTNRAVYEESKRGEVEIKDVDHSSMMKLLKYVYTGASYEFVSDIDTAEGLIDLMMAADKYALSELVDECALATFSNGCKVISTRSRSGEFVELDGIVTFGLGRTFFLVGFIVQYGCIRRGERAEGEDVGGIKEATGDDL